MATFTSRVTRRIGLGAVVAVAPVLVAVGTAAASQAQGAPSPGMGCETVHWGFLGGDRREVCDGAKQADGSWQRTRTVFTPSHYQPLNCLSGGSGNLTCFGGYLVPETTQTQESYPVTADTVLPDEPGWLPPGTDNIL
ncbi:hypothetical protein H7K45_23525 [Mycobacterium yunnanensis]|uniref:CDGP domain-containing protein n=1 Tax=Mycobacterium yunnanensis TaxID=368477 RepID=A0A9X3C3T1_9MYCO|nr:hypothetical protein [Mycobacterium yunnanensis]MCV7423531.1 hypothetical protein [Mycobacterium yunnanensis]